ncbi:MAG: hypothetical protein ACYDCJ_12160 [Gammaproteobacteria bacterium]
MNKFVFTALFVSLFITGCNGSHSPPDMTGSYRVEIYGQAGTRFSNFVIAGGALVISDKSITKDKLPIVPDEEARANAVFNVYKHNLITHNKMQNYFYQMHTLTNYTNPESLNVCIWLRPGEIDTGFTSLSSFVLTSASVTKGEIYIPLFRSPDAGSGIGNIEKSGSGFQGIVETWFFHGTKHTSAYRLFAIRDNSVTMKDCLEDGVHVAIAQDYIDDAQSKAQEELFNWSSSEKKVKPGK